ncbi:MAG TPA: AAA domain-containing protein [Gaiellaceae bacterium]|nr:AAA domain-containing protein [Gaiellaceae bacterium]
MSSTWSGPSTLAATTLAQFVRLESCERYLWYRLHAKETRDLFRRYRVTEQPLTPLLSQRGARHESEITTQLAAEGRELVDLAEQGADRTAAELARGATSARVLLQARVEGTIGAFPAAGVADLVLVEPGSEGGVRVTVGDAKASRRDRPEHRLQVAFYALLLRQLAARAGVHIEEMRGCVWRVPQGPEDEQPSLFDLQAYEEAVELLAGEGSRLLPVAAGSREQARFHLTYKCDGCLYNALCMREAAEGETLALVPFLSSRDRTALERHGVRSLLDLARLKGLPPPGDYEAPLAPVADPSLLARLAAEWPLGANLDLHVQRARAVARNWHAEVEWRPWIHGSGFGTLPDPEAFPGLVRVYLDAQHDFLEDRVYLAAGLVVGPRGRREVLEITDGPPGEEQEGRLVEAWVTRLLAAVREVADGDTLYLHLYVYDGYDQKVVLDAIRRHLDRLAGLPDVFDLLTETAATSQAMFSFLAREVRERKNLGLLCHSLPLVARRLGFDWSFEGVELHRVFQARVFDNRRTLPDGRWYESAARFNSQIPLEYAYGAWGRLPEPEDAESRRLLEPFRVTLDELLHFARARLHALHHLDESFRVRNRFLPKEPIRLPDPRVASGAEPRLADVLLEFLYVEHHAKLQGLLSLFALPLERRVASGASLLLEALEDADRGRCRFRIRFDLAGLDPVPALQQMAPEEGDWMVIGPARASAKPWDVVRGRIAVIDAIEDDEIVLHLMPMSFGRSEFRFAHNASLAIARGALYVLDPMADDLVAERVLDACRNADHNAFLAWIERGPEAIGSRGVSAAERQALGAFLEALEQAASILTPTQRQGDVIAHRSRERVLLVQGPPGTGKTHTLAWAILARAYAAALAGRSFHVLVSAMTHTAVEVVLRSIADKLGQLDQEPAAAHLAEALSGLRLFKEQSVPGPVPEGVEAVERDDLLECLEHELAVIAAVPSGVHRLLQGVSKPIDWSRRRFDLLVIDEASQLSLPAAVLAGAPLRDEGQAIVVGDHRQMPPILTHDWKHEPRRRAQETNVYASAFESLRDRGFPIVGLDQSFRLHREHAAFLEHHVYREDNVGFHSLRAELLPSCAGLDGHVAAALAPEFPVVVVEHAEQSSLKRNDTEIAILAPIVEAARDRLGLDATDGLGVVVPHRAQRAALKALFPDLAGAGAIDTVERFQGGERDLIVVSATASDPEFVLAEARFLLNPNRLNVAFSRPRKKLIVIGSTTVFRLVPPDMEVFESALLWKRLRYEFSAEVLWEGEVAGVPVRVSGRRALRPSR